MKPRSDSKLKNLPEERQEQIAAWAAEPKSEICPGGLAHAREQLAADGIRVSLSTLSEFISWWGLKRRFAAADSRARQVEELLAQNGANMSPERIRELGQALFTLEALEEKDPETYVSLERLQLDKTSAKEKASIDREKLKLSREKFERETCETFLRWYGERRAREIADGPGTNDEKIAALRAEYFRDVEALEKSGDFRLPE